MCGIAGVIDLAGKRPVPPGTLAAMANTLIHRGPDDDGYLEQPGIGLASRRLSIIGLLDGRQPLTNEDHTVHMVFNGEIFEYPELRKELEARGHRFATHTDSEVIPHLWEEYGDGLLECLRGQFAFALYDERQRRLLLARDRFGICPLFWTRQNTPDGDWLLFASEIKALLASGMVDARPDPRGINHAFTFFAVPGPVTCFQGIHYLPPGRFLQVHLDRGGHADAVRERTYWQLDFPDQGYEERGPDTSKLVDDFERVLLAATERRLRADVPVVSYLSGGVDSSLVVALASKIRGEPIPTFTIQIKDPRLDETSEAALAARHVGTEPIVVPCGAAEVLRTYPRLIQAAESPVIDTACAAMVLLAREVHARGYKVALTGEGADEWLAGYPWFKVHRVLGMLDVIPGLQLSLRVRRLFLRLTGAPRFPWAITQRIRKAIGGSNAWLDVYGLVALSKLRFFSSEMWDRLGDHLAYDDLDIPLDRFQRWHPLHRSLYFGGRVMLPGLLLNAKGDRAAMHSSVETRYPFLDEDVYDFLAQVHPRWKLRGLRDKFLLRQLAERWLPPAIAHRRKAMFRAPFDSFHAENLPPFVDELLSEDSLRKTGYFNPEAVRQWRLAFRTLRPGSTQRTSIEMGLVGVVSTQLWHHTYMDASLADLPSLAAAAEPAFMA
jgi:asparagine synthase (glutamine-hydrolysing)